MNILSDMLSSANVERLGWTLLHSVWQFALMGVLLSALLAAMQRKSAEARYLAAWIGLLAMLTISVTTYWWPVTSPTAERTVTTATDGASPTEGIDVRDEAAPDDLAETSPLTSPELADDGPYSALAAEPALVWNDGPSAGATNATPASMPHRIAAALAPSLPWVSMAWLGGVILVSVRHVGGWVGVQRLRSVGTSAVGPDLTDRARRLLDCMKISRPVRILQSSLAELPIVIGWLRPVVLLPASLLTGLSPKQLEAVLAHELAHVRRYDYFFNLLQAAAETLLFYHPAVWWLSRRIRIEREFCCDDVAITVCGNNVDYAEALAAVEQRRAAALAMALGGHGRMGTALERVRRVLGSTQEDKPYRSSATGAGLAALFLVVAFVGYLAVAGEGAEGQPQEQASGAENNPVETEITATSQPEDQVGSIAGRVLDSTGKPVAGAKVFLPGTQTLLLIDGEDRFRSRTSVETDVQGRFVLARDGGEKAHRVIVTSPSLHVWTAPVPRLGEELTIRLPEPATVVLRYDIEGDLPEVRFRLQLDHTKKPGWTGVVDSIQYPVAENGGQVVVKLTPGRYGLARLKPLSWRPLNMNRFRKNAHCDQQVLEVKDGERKVVDFRRPAGQRISGEVVGLSQDLRKDVFVYVSRTGKTWKPMDSVSVVHPVGVLDAVTSNEAGQFTTARIPPGAYTVIAHVYKPGPHHDATGELLPDLAGMARVTVSENGESPKVRIEMMPTSRDASASGQAKFSPRELFSASHGVDTGILAVAFSPNGKVVAALDQTSKVVLRDAGTGAQIVSFDLLTSAEKELVSHKYPIRRILYGALAFSPDGKTLAVGGDPVVRLYEAETGRPQRVLKDKQLADEFKRVGGSDSEELKKIDAVPHAHGTSVHSIAFSPDGTMLATSGQQFLASGATPGHLKLWGTETGKMTQNLGLHFSAVRSVAFTPDGKVLASAGMHPPRWTVSVRLWDPQSGAVKNVFQIPRGYPWSVAFSPDGKLVAAGGIVDDANENSGMLLVWDARTGAPLFNRSLPTPVTSVAFSADGETLASGEYDRGVTLWDPDTLKAKCKLYPIDPPSAIEGSVHVVFSPAGNLLAATAEHAEQGGFVTAWSLIPSGMAQ